MTDDKATMRWSLYAILIVIATAMMVAQVARVRSPDAKSPTPFQSGNDRSRWATIRALGDDGTYAIEHVIFDSRGNRVRGWYTIDLVRHRGRDGREHYYSSKPTLLTTLLAGEYWLIKAATGATLENQTDYVARLMLILTNVLQLAAALVLLARLIEEQGASDWARLLAVAAACFATFLTTFAATLNNHLTAAISLVIALAVSLPIIRSFKTDAAFVGQTVPQVMNAGMQYPVSVTIRNSGTSTWVAGGGFPYRLGSQSPRDNVIWGSGRQPLPATIPPGAPSAWYGCRSSAPRVRPSAGLI
jgi:uncharacterized membrane protein YhaH (DUF805 family)